MSYFEQTKLGESRWWSWIALSWLAFVGWMLFQTILILPIPVIANFTDPPLIEPLMQAFQSSGGTEKTESYSSMSLIAGLSATLAAILVPFLPDDKSRNICGALLLMAIIICTVFSIMGSQGTDTSGVMKVLTQIMGASPLAFAFFLLTFPAGLIALYIGQRVIHKRTLTSLHTAAKKIRVNRVVQGFFLTWIVLGLFSLIGNALGLMEVQYVFDPGRFWVFALVSLLFIPFQAATEEIVFRGYFNQGLTHLLRSKWIAFALTSLAFMALHLSNPEALEGAASGALPIVMSGYFFFGFAMCLVVWLDDGLETAIGIHAGNNCFAAIIMNYENSVLPTPSIFLTGTDPVKDSISTVLVLSVLVGLIWLWRGVPNTRGHSGLA